MSYVWLVTGSSRGIGRALVLAALAAGHRVVATARRPDSLSELGELGRVFPLDVTDPGAAEAAVRFAVDQFGRLDVVVNNAGYANSSAIEETPADDFRAQVEANFFGTVNVTRAALPVLRAQRSGHIIQISSVGGRVGGTPGMGAYQSAKFAVEGFSEVLHNEVAPLGIKVTIVEPGGFRTDWGGSSMTIPAVGPDYADTVGRLNDFRRASAGQQPGDPVRAASVIVGIAGSADPPLRLLLGSDALNLAERASESRAAEAVAWADVTRSTDFTPPSVVS